jgi:N-acyl homoserine lactone hydrolase
MISIGLRVAAAVAIAPFGCPAWSQSETSGIDQLYVLDRGQGHAGDQSRWSPGVNVGVPLDIVDNCYLIHHAQGYLLWDTGISDRVAALPEGEIGTGTALVWRKPKTLATQLDQIGVKPSDVRYIAVSHTHSDHVGNVDMLPTATLLIQKAEYDWAFAANGNPTFFASGVPRFSLEHPTTKLDGDHDVFGDGSAVLISTPGHTPGHQSLLVHLPKTGWLVLSGDAVHFKDNWDHRRVPGLNADKDKTLASMQRIADLMVERHAELWISVKAAHMRRCAQRRARPSTRPGEEKPGLILRSMGGTTISFSCR